MLTHLLVAFALAMDAFAVSVSSGICIKDIRPAIALRAALFFGLFQFLMPVAGWLLGGAFKGLIQGWDHWLALGLLAFIGGKMILEAWKKRDPSYCADPDEAAGIMSLKTLTVLAIATSLDALAVGLSYSVLGDPILGPAALIGVVTFILCVLGIEFGKKLGAAFESKAEMAGGAVLILIGLKIAGQNFIEKI